MSTLAPLAFLLLAIADPPDPLSALENAVAEAIAKAEPSVVAITRIQSSDGEETTAVRGRNPAPVPEAPAFAGGFLVNPAASDYVAIPSDCGSGVVVGDAGEILTAHHFIKGASRIRVRAAGKQEFDAEIIAADPRSDLAVIVPRGPNAPKLKPLPLGDASKLRKGAFLVVLGNPYNAARDGRASAGLGILSNVARRLSPSEDARMLGNPLQSLRQQPSLLQLDAKLNLGMSGGAVVNLKGELVGITTTGGNPLGFDALAGYAIPMDALGRRAVEALRQGKEVEYGFLGIAIDPVVSNRVRDVRVGTPAVEAELLAGDLIVAVGGQPVAEDGLSLALSAVPPGGTVKLTVRRDGKLLEKSVTMAKFPVQVPPIVTNRPPPWRGARVDFSSVLTATMFEDEIARRFPQGGVGVLDVDSGSAAESAGLKRGQVITHVDGRPVRTPAEFSKAVGGRKGPVTLTTELGDEPDKKIVVK